MRGRVYGKGHTKSTFRNNTNSCLVMLGCMHGCMLLAWLHAYMLTRLQLHRTFFDLSGSFLP